MTVLTYSEILTSLCDKFDSYIAPKRIKRVNSNVIYLILKAAAYGFETINNICVTLAYKFNPLYCSSGDLDSIAKIAGTKRISGKGSSLVIYATNTSGSSAVLPAGTYTYAFDADTGFSFTLNTPVTVDTLASTTLIAITSAKGSYHVTAQQSIVITAADSSDNALTVPDAFSFSCADNSSYLGYEDETDVEFRSRINKDQTRENLTVEMQTALKNLPYIYDALVTFNASAAAVTVGSYSLPPYTMLIVLRGNADESVAETVASYGIFPTLDTGDAQAGTVYYAADCFAGGQYPVHFVNFGSTDYSVTLTYTYDASVISSGEIQSAVASALASYSSPVKWSRYITEKDFYDAVTALSLKSVTLLDVALKNAAGAETAYIETDRTKISRLTSVTYNGSGA